MIRNIGMDLLCVAVPIVIGLLLFIHAVHTDQLPPISGVQALRMTFAQYESMGPDFMDDANREIQP